MLRRATLIVAAVSAAACATGGQYSPRPFPTAPGPVMAHVPLPDAPGLSAPPPLRAAGPVLDSERSITAASILTTALGLRGTPYRLGGSDPAAGFDCSGFVQYVLRQHSIAMPRTVVEQYEVGEIRPSPEPGDLVFFQTVGSKPSHVGIAIDGQTFVHAPNSRGVVRVDRFDTPYWAERFVGARRLF